MRAILGKGRETIRRSLWPAAIIGIVVALVFSGCATVSGFHRPQVGGGTNPFGGSPREGHRQNPSVLVTQSVLAAWRSDDPGGPFVQTTVPVGTGPVAAAYDSVKGEVFVANEGSNNSSVINDTSNTVVGTIHVGSQPEAMAYDAAKGEVFVANVGSSNVSVINDTTDTVVATIPVGTDPFGAAYDAAKGEVFIANWGSSNVSVISAATNKVVATVAAGFTPLGLAYDRANGEIFVTNWGLNNVSVINDTTDMVVATIPVGPSPRGVAYDSARGEVFTNNFGSSAPFAGSVSVISVSTNKVVATVPVGEGPWDAVYDPATGEVFVTNAYTNNVSVINDTSDAVVATIPISGAPAGVAFDAAKGEVYVTDGGLDEVSVISFLPTYTVTFAETALPIGLTWYVNITGQPSLHSTTPAITASLSNGSYSYTVGVTFVGKKAYSAPVGTFSVAGGAKWIALAFLPVYPVTFKEKGLPPGTDWWVNVTGWGSTSSVGATLRSWEATGSYSYKVTSENTSYAVKGGTFAIHAKAVSVKVRFHLVTYVVTVSESGLPAKSRWCIDIRSPAPAIKDYCTTRASESFSEPNGTYGYSLVTPKARWSAPSGSITVNGAPVSKSVTFSD